MPDDVLAALSDFAARIDVYEPGAATVGELTLTLNGRETVLTLRAPVAAALAAALRAYQDPRDRGACDHCGGRRMDDNFRCADCGGLSGVFGQLVAEQAARYTEPAALPGLPEA
jgi:hypothetical protein